MRVGIVFFLTNTYTPTNTQRCPSRLDISCCRAVTAKKISCRCRAAAVKRNKLPLTRRDGEEEQVAAASVDISATTI